MVSINKGRSREVIAIIASAICDRGYIHTRACFVRDIPSVGYLCNSHRLLYSWFFLFHKIFWHRRFSVLMLCVCMRLFYPKVYYELYFVIGTNINTRSSISFILPYFCFTSLNLLLLFHTKSNLENKNRMTKCYLIQSKWLSIILKFL